ncbi:MAG: hypothetical protein VKK80_11735 [Prochlorothrix sp.]|nr:hypothetical protein [Prochlorothrix sp.]
MFTSQSVVRHQQKIDEIAQKLQEQGYEVILEPEVSLLPFDLGSYRPDILAFGQQGGVIVEVKGEAQNFSVDRLHEIAKIVSSHAGWQFWLATAQDLTDSSRPQTPTDLPTWEDLNRQLLTVTDLLEQDLLEPSLLYLWSIVEAILRKRAIFLKLPLAKLGTRPLINHLYSQGEISLEEFDILQLVQPQRNRVAHGLTATLQQDTLRTLLMMAGTWLSHWRS